jgi:hypothetical protein
MHLLPVPILWVIAILHMLFVSAARKHLGRATAGLPGWLSGCVLGAAVLGGNATTGTALWALGPRVLAHGDLVGTLMAGLGFLFLHVGSLGVLTITLGALLRFGHRLGRLLRRTVRTAPSSVPSATP